MALIMIKEYLISIIFSEFLKKIYDIVSILKYKKIEKIRPISANK